MHKYTQRFIVPFSLTLLFVGCSPSPVPNIKQTSLKIMYNEKNYYVDKKAKVETGKASYYANCINGRRTASGEICNLRRYTAAHRSLPFGTIIRVTMLQNGKSVLVRVNDRGPHGKGRIIDLSTAAAQDIGLTRAGIAKVKIEKLRKLY